MAVIRRPPSGIKKGKRTEPNRLSEKPERPAPSPIDVSLSVLDGSLKSVFRKAITKSLSS